MPDLRVAPPAPDDPETEAEVQLVLALIMAAGQTDEDRVDQAEVDRLLGVDRSPLSGA